MSHIHADILPVHSDNTEYRRLDDAQLGEPIALQSFNGEDILCVKTDALRLLAETAFHDINHLLRPSHLQQLNDIFADKQATPNDKYVAFEMLKNANIAAGGVFPMCQDTGTAIIMGKKGRRVWTGGKDAEALAEGVHASYLKNNLRYSQLSPLSMYEEVNTRNNLPAQIEIYHEGEEQYKFLFIAKGGGSANKSFFYQCSPSQLERARMLAFLDEKIRTLGTAACPPYHLAIVIGGTSAEFNMKTMKLASARYLDSLPTQGGDQGQGFRDTQMEAEILEMTQNMGIGAQFGGKYFCLDVRVIRLPRHGASLPVGIGVSCSADRQALGKITRKGVFLEKLETNPARFLPDTETSLSNEVIHIDLNQDMSEILKKLDQCPVKTRISISGPMIVARDSAHRRIRQQTAQGKPFPEYFKKYAVYYAGPAKTPEGYPSGSFGPTTAGRMDGFVDEFQKMGGSMIMLAKGNRSPKIRKACAENGGFYLGSIGGPGAALGRDCIKKIEVLDFEDLGMEAVWKIEVENFPAFVIIDNKGNDFFKGLMPE